MYKLSIIVPVYNVEKYINQCIDSILNQTLNDFELILINDGSTDKSGIICDEYCKIDSRIKVIHKENGGLSSARNAGIDASRGRYIGFVDSDDWIEKDMYEVLYKNIEEYQSDISICGMNRVTNNQYIKQYDTGKLEVLNKVEAMEKLLQGREIRDYFCDKLYRRELFDNFRFPNGKIFEDASCQYKMFNMSDRIVYNDLAKYNYRMTQNSIVRAAFTPAKLDWVEATEELLKFTERNYPKLYEFALQKYVNSNFSLMMQIINGDYKQYKKEYYLLLKNLKNKYKEINCNPYIEKHIKFHIKLIKLFGFIHPYIWKFKLYTEERRNK